MGLFNSKAAVQQNERPFILLKTNKNKKEQRKEGKLAINKQKISDQSDRNGTRISRLNSETEGNCDTNRSRAQSEAPSDAKRTFCLPQYDWLVASPVERYDGKKNSETGLKCGNLESSLPLLRGQKAKDELTLIDLISEGSQSAGNSFQKLPSNNCATKRHSALRNIVAPSRSETSFEHYKPSSDSDVSAIVQKAPLKSVGFGVLMPNSHLDQYVTGRGPNAHCK